MNQNIDHQNGPFQEKGPVKGLSAELNALMARQPVYHGAYAQMYKTAEMEKIVYPASQQPQPEVVQTVATAAIVGGDVPVDQASLYAEAQQPTQDLAQAVPGSVDQARQNLHAAYKLQSPLLDDITQGIGRDDVTKVA